MAAPGSPPAGAKGPAFKESLMRYAPAALALSLVVAVTASAGMGAASQPDPRAAALATTIGEDHR